MLPKLLFRMVIILVGLRLAKSQAYQVQPINNTGILFENIGEVLLYHETWNIFTELDIEELENQTNVVQQAEIMIHLICNNHSIGPLVCESQKSQLHNIIQNIQRRTTIIKELVSPTRFRRSLFDGIGNAFHFLFGTMDNENERYIYSKINDLEKDSEALLELEKQQISVMRTTFDGIHKPLREVALNQKNMLRQINDLLDLVENDLSIRLKLQELLTAVTLQILDVEIRQQNLLDIMVALTHNELHPLLISQNALLGIYSKVNIGKFNSKKMPNILKEVLETKSMFVHNKLVIRITFPILDSTPFDLKQIHLFPIRVHDNYSLVLNTEFSYIANKYATQEFILLKRNDFSRYKKLTYNSHSQVVYVGRLVQPVISGDTTNICIINLLFNPLNQSVHCSYSIQVQQTDIILKLNKANTWLFTFTRQYIIKILCADSVKVSSLANNGILSIQDKCNIRIENKVLYYEGQDHRNFTIFQPAYFPPTHYYFNESVRGALRHFGNSTEQIFALTNDEHIDALFKASAISLDTITTKLNDLEEDKRSRSSSRNLQMTTISLSSFVLILLLCLAAIKIIHMLRQKWTSPKDLLTKVEVPTPPPRMEQTAKQLEH